MSIHFKFKIQKGDFCLDVDQSISADGVTAIFGASGCGKTTLLRAIAGFEPLKNNFLEVVGNIWQDEQVFLEAHKRELGFVFQEASLFTHLSVQENLEYGLKRSSQKDTQNLNEIIELLGLSELLKRSTRKLSGGEQQRVAIARALARSPKLLLLDEPLAALDDERKNEILPYLEKLNQKIGIPIIYVSHSKEEVARLADHVLILEKGEVAAYGSVLDIFSRADLNLSHEQDSLCIIEGRVKQIDKSFNLMTIEFDGGEIVAAVNNFRIGDTLRLKVKASDVSLTLSKQDDTSILNIIKSRVLSITPLNITQSLIRLEVGSSHLLSRVTNKSVEHLGLIEGKEVYSQIKTVVVLS
jgi:molybdate transport system ATP-binding protein